MEGGSTSALAREAEPGQGPPPAPRGARHALTISRWLTASKPRQAWRPPPTPHRRAAGLAPRSGPSPVPARLPGSPEVGAFPPPAGPRKPGCPSLPPSLPPVGSGWCRVRFVGPLFSSWPFAFSLLARGTQQALLPQRLWPGWQPLLLAPQSCTFSGLLKNWPLPTLNDSRTSSPTGESEPLEPPLLWDYRIPSRTDFCLLSE